MEAAMTNIVSRESVVSGKVVVKEVHARVVFGELTVGGQLVCKRVAVTSRGFYRVGRGGQEIPCSHEDLSSLHITPETVLWAEVETCPDAGPAIALHWTFKGRARSALSKMKCKRG
jgi:hypothetical protein